MVRRSSLFSWSSLKEYRKLAPDEYLEWNAATAKPHAVNAIFVSHRWITPLDPDPEGHQLRELQNRLSKLLASDGSQDFVVFYDYCSMLQRPRTVKEDAYFRRDIAGLESLIRSSYKTIILSEGYTDYRDRRVVFL
jgi:hypothetical protein